MTDVSAWLHLTNSGAPEASYRDWRRLPMEAEEVRDRRAFYRKENEAWRRQHALSVWNAAMAVFMVLAVEDWCTNIRTGKVTYL